VPPKSNYWRFFIRTSEGARCKIWQHIVKTSGNTTNLRFHMSRCHPNVKLEMVEISNKENKSDSNVAAESLTKRRKVMVIYN
jgi:hypothetical protein